MTTTILRSTSIAALALAPFITGCATKKYVKATVTPIEQRVGDLDGTTKAQAKSIEELERGVARADERAQGAQGKADTAAEQANLARKEAADGKNLAEQGLVRADQLGKDMNDMGKSIHARIENLQNYKLVTTDQVLFLSGQSELNKESMALLDSAVAKVTPYKNFVVEVQGFTDNTGSKSLNLELSRKRADAVVRYLTSKHSMPLHRVFVAGYGMDNQVADNKSRDGRKLNRRVELRVFAPGNQAPTQISSTSSPTN
jgi:OOP family OmpA-OmpF porin